MAYVEVDVDLDEFDTKDLVDELLDRLKRERGRKALSDKQKDKLKEELKVFYKEMFGITNVPLECKTLDDQLKIEFLKTVWDKYTPTEMEQKLKH